MIQIPKTSVAGPNGLAHEPERALAENEKKTVVAQWGNETHYIYFEQEDIGGDLWLDYEAHLSQPPQSSPGRALQNFMDATPEEKLQIAQQLKPILDQLNK